MGKLPNVGNDRLWVEPNVSAAERKNLQTVNPLKTACNSFLIPKAYRQKYWTCWLWEKKKNRHSSCDWNGKAIIWLYFPAAAAVCLHTLSRALTGPTQSFLGPWQDFKSQPPTTHTPNAALHFRKTCWPYILITLCRWCLCDVQIHHRIVNLKF